MSQPSPELRFYTDRTSIETDWKCARKRFLRSHAGPSGRGLVPVKEPIHFLHGRETHHDLAQIALGANLDEIIAAAGPAPSHDQDLFEAWSRRVGWAVAWHDFGWPVWAANHDVVMVEREVVLRRGPLYVATTADLVLRDRRDGKLVIPDFKTVGMLNKGWQDHWPYAIQMSLNPLAVGEELGEQPKFGIIIGLMKGNPSGAKLRHPYIWAYSDGGDGWSTEWKRDWTLRPVFEYPGGVPAWVRQLGAEVGRMQFPYSAPIFVNHRLVDALIAQRARREAEVAEGIGEARTNPSKLDQLFPQSFEQCRPVIGGACEFLHACHSAVVMDDPIGSGLYVERVSHHPIEAEIREDEE